MKNKKGIKSLIRDAIKATGKYTVEKVWAVNLEPGWDKDDTICMRIEVTVRKRKRWERSITNHLKITTMTKKIFKYPLETTGVQTIDMPEGAEILTVQTQREVPCLWTLIDPNAPPLKRTIEIFGTGHEVTDGSRRYIGTYQLYNGKLVFHCFELLES